MALGNISTMFSAVYIIVVLIIWPLFRNMRRVAIAEDSPPSPGPRPLPFIGNVHQIPTKMLWRVFSEWDKIYAMIISPDVQRNAQEELDEVVGADRLPCMSISDRANLPYIRSIVAEVLRWGPSVPLSVPHALTEDDIYEGYHLSKGAIVVPNIWHMLRDPEVYADPLEFRSERFNGEDAEMAKVTDLAFGLGRRACPGKNFADAILFANIATTLATCHVLPGINDKVEEIIPEYAYAAGNISFLEAFSLRLRPRSAKAAALLSEATAIDE